MTTASSRDTLARFTGHAVIIDTVDVGEPDCVVVAIRPAGHGDHMTRHLAISALPTSGLTVEELRPGHPTLLRLALRRRLHPAPDGPGDAA